MADPDAQARAAFRQQLLQDIARAVVAGDERAIGQALMRRPPPPQRPTSTKFPEILEPIASIDKRLGRIHPSSMNKDSQYTQIHFHRARDADLLEQFCRDKLPADDIYVPAQHQPINPEDEDDVVPEQHAAFGIQRATQARREPAWRDFGLGELMTRGPDPAAWKGAAAQGTGGAGGVGVGRAGGSRLPR